MAATASARGVMLSPGQVTIVVASPRDARLLDACLQSVLPQARVFNAPVIVARPGDLASVTAAIAPAGSLGIPVAVPGAPTLPELRGAGLRAVQTPFAALTEDHCVATPGWLSALTAEIGDADFVGGRMGNAQRARTVDWAAYFAEYGFFTGQPVRGGPALATAANVLYGPRALPRAAAWATEGFWEDVIHARLIAAGCRLAFTPAAEVQQNQRYEISAFCADRFRHGFAYARVRLTEQPFLHRWIRAAASPLLPAVLAQRVRAGVTAAERVAFFRALPLTLTFLGAWALGEMMGYVRGPAR
jgi:hypothetical protein